MGTKKERILNFQNRVTDFGASLKSKIVSSKNSVNISTGHRTILLLSISLSFGHFQKTACSIMISTGKVILLLASMIIITQMNPDIITLKAVVQKNVFLQLILSHTLFFSS